MVVVWARMPHRQNSALLGRWPSAKSTNSFTCYSMAWTRCITHRANMPGQTRLCVRHWINCVKAPDKICMRPPQLSTGAQWCMKCACSNQRKKLRSCAVPERSPRWRIPGRWKNAVRECLNTSWKVRFTTNLPAMARVTHPITRLSAAVKTAVSCITLKMKV